MQWLQQHGVDQETLGALRRTVSPPTQVQAPREPWKDLQSAHAKVKTIDKQLDAIDDKINDINRELASAQDARDDLVAKRDEIIATIDTLTPKSELSSYVSSLEKIIKSIQSKLSAGLPEAGSDSQTSLYNTVFKGSTTPPISIPGDSVHDRDMDDVRSVCSEQQQNESKPQTNDLSPVTEPAAATATAGSPDPTEFLVDTQGFGFNPVPRKGNALSAPYTKPSRVGDRGADLFSQTLPCALAPGSALGKA